MKIAQLKSSANVGGAEVMLLALCRGLRAMGHDVRVFIGEEGWLSTELRSDRFAVDTAKLTTISGVLHIARLWKWLKHFDPDVVVYHGARIGLYGTLVCRILSKPCVAVEHSVEPWRARPGWRSMVDLWMARRGSMRIAVSEAVRRSIMQARVLPAERLEVIPNGVCVGVRMTEDERQVVRRRMGVRCDSFALLMVGRLVEAKGYAVALDAIRIVADKRGDVDLYIIGDGPLRVALCDQMRSLRLQHRVTFLGEMRNAGSVMAAFDGFVMSSFWEGMPIALLEAMECGVPVIATRVGGVPEIVEDQVDGMLVNSGDAKHLAEGIVRLVDDAVFRERIANRAMAKVRKQFSVDGMTKAYEKLLARVVVEMNG